MAKGAMEKTLLDSYHLAVLLQRKRKYPFSSRESAEGAFLSNPLLCFIGHHAIIVRL